METSENDEASQRHGSTWRYLAGIAAAASLSFAAIWLYVIVAPLAFLEGGYPGWVAKQNFIQTCDLGDLTVFGDSRAEAAIDPGNLNIGSRNISLGAVTPVEAYFFIRAALRCPRLPRQVVLSFSTPSFESITDFLWENAARYGYLSYADLREIDLTARRIGDPSIDRARNRIGVYGAIRDALYASRFPPLYFNSLVHAQIFRRYGINRSIRENVGRALGHVTYQHPPPGAGRNADPEAAHDFAPSPIETYYFSKSLDLLRQSGVRAIFIAMPVSQSSRELMPAGSAERFSAYLHAFVDHDPDFQVVDPVLVVWPDSLFGDGTHVDAEGARLFTRQFDACQKNWAEQLGPSVRCDFSLGAAGGASLVGPR